MGGRNGNFRGVDDSSSDSTEVQSGLERDGTRLLRDKGGVAVSLANVSLVVGDQGAVWTAGVPYSSNDCRSSEDCDDGDLCSLDACVKVRSLLFGSVMP